jgi:hypothetical protein
MVRFFLAIVRIGLFIAIMKSLHLMIKWAFSTSLLFGFGLCALIISACFAVAAIVDGRLVLWRARRGMESEAPPAPYPPRES